MLSFESDYTVGAHEKILEKLREINLCQQPGYGNDPFCASAKEKIKAACACPEAQIFFVAGGTQANAIVAASVLRRYEGVVAVSSGHVSVHEAGAIEYTGHKVLELAEHDGKMDARELEAYLDGYFSDGNCEHMAAPGMVYISHPTEYGTLYTHQELADLSEVCKTFQIPLYLDGARLGYGLAAKGTDVTLADVARYCDIFYIGGTKVGALFGEAIVFTKGNMPPHFLSLVKQQGGLLAKGWILGTQFDVLFTDGLYLKISRNAIEMAERMKQGFLEKGYHFFRESPTNQQFLLLENEEMEALQKKVVFGVWEKPDDAHTAVRFATSWATTDEDIKRLLALL